jgi:hypothetical protein
MTIVGVHWRPDSELAAPLKAHNCHRLSMITDVVSEVLPAVLADRVAEIRGVSERLADPLIETEAEEPAARGLEKSRNS